MKTLALCVLSLLLAGCFPKPQRATPDMIAGASFGAAPTEQAFESAIKKWAENYLLDVDSAKYDFSAPIKRCYLSESANRSGKVLGFGWCKSITVNAKNRFGGYVGKQFYSFFYEQPAAHLCALDDWNEPVGWDFCAYVD